MNIPNKIMSVVAFTITFLFLCGLAVPQARADERISSQVKVSPNVQLTNTQKDSLSLAAEQILQQVKEARSDITYSGGAKALKHVQKGLELVNIINIALPEYDLTTTIKSGNATYRDEKKRKQSVIPVSGELDELFTRFPYTNTGKQGAEGKQPTGKSEGDADVRYSRTFLDVRDAEFYLKQAAADLQTKDIAQADTSLATLQDNVIHELDEVDLPLLSAGLSPIEAARMAVHNQYSGAKVFLKEATDRLKMYKSEVGRDAAKTTQGTINEIKKISNVLQEQKESSAQKLNKIWNKIVNSL
ncbi:MAG TPA: hypothetical protein VK463_03395 [Desulfomonilaceae bacterium]|nr:hypothetical protein [Desulfomonilaceae bacterium]